MTNKGHRQGSRLSSVHFLLTYRCQLRCAHCFVNSSPEREERMSRSFAEHLLQSVRGFGVPEVFFEGGEPTTEMNLLLHCLSFAKNLGLKATVVTNGLETVNDSSVIDELLNAGAVAVQISKDAYHTVDHDRIDLRVLEVKDAIPGTIEISFIEKVRTEGDDEKVDSIPEWEQNLENLFFRGRAARLNAVETRLASEFLQCEFEPLENPERVHIGPDGYVQVCQGLSIGNVKEAGLGEIIEHHCKNGNEVTSTISSVGPYGFARRYAPHLTDSQFADSCQLCFLSRQSVIKDFPQVIAPKEIYDI